ncbi:MAG: NAD(P)-dependent oxidoreductase, partial [Candidatus Promineifilaceae bacterium]
LDSRIALTTGDLGSFAPETQILIAGRPTQEQVESCPKLQTVIIPWAGLPDVTRELMLGYPQIKVHNLHHNAAPVAELAFALLLAASKFILPFDRALREADWRPRYKPNPSMLLKDKSALILGFGAIGQRLARICRAFDMKVLAVKRTITSTAEALAHELYTLEALPKILPRADVLFVCFPLTPETEGVIGARELAALPQGAILVNVGRGPLIQEEALFLALKDGHLAGAGLDVWYYYPSSEEERSYTRPSVYPFHELENVVLSPHRGGATADTNYLRMDGVAELLNAAAAGKMPPNRVDVTAGY